MKVLISGSSGLVGKALVSFLRTCGHTVVRLVRFRVDQADDAIYWNEEDATFDDSLLEGFDAVINLAGESIASRWIESKKKRLYDSRVAHTSYLAALVARLKNPPKVFINASAIGYYGDCKDTILTESSPCGKGFLAGLCKDWEAALKPLTDSGIRTAFLRFGVVLAKEGGALSRMLLGFRLGLGGILGNGEQYMSWIALDDLVAIVLYVLMHPTIDQAVNVVSPQPVTNLQFTKTLGSVLNRPTVLRVPAIALQFFLGQEMAKEVMLASQRVLPAKLIQEGYSFLYPDLRNALKHILDK